MCGWRGCAYGACDASVAPVDLHGGGFRGGGWRGGGYGWRGPTVPSVWASAPDLLGPTVDTRMDTVTGASATVAYDDGGCCLIRPGCGRTMDGSCDQFRSAVRWGMPTIQLILADQRRQRLGEVAG